MKFKTEPYAHQKEAFERFKDSDAYALFWEMGTGKTKTSIDIATHKFLTGQCNRNVIIAPNYVHAQWINEQLPAHCSVPFNAFTYESKSTNKYMEALMRFLDRCNDPTVMHWLAIHVEAFQYEKIELVLSRFLKNQIPFWIVDEATRIKNPDAKSVSRLCNLRKKYGGSASALTGTILAKSPVHVWQIIEFIKQGYMGCSYTAFNRRHAIITKHQVEITRNGRKFTTKVDIAITPKKFWQVKHDLKLLEEEKAPFELEVKDYSTLAFKYDLSYADLVLIKDADQFVKYKNIDQLKIQVSPISSAVKKDACLDLPEKQYQEVVLPLSPEQKRILLEMKKYSVAQYKDKELTIQHKAALQTRALQVLGGFFPHMKDLNNLEEKVLYASTPLEGKNAKLDYILHDLEEVGDMPFIIWAVFVPELELLHKEINKIVPVGLLSGSTAKDDRSDITLAFKSGELQGVIANPVAFGYGHNWQHAPLQYWYSRNYRTEARLQAEDRSHRIGSKTSPLYKDLIYDVEFEKIVLRNNKEGKDMNDYFNTTNVAELFSI